MKKSLVFIALLIGCMPQEEPSQSGDKQPPTRCQPAEVSATDAAIAVADSSNAFAADMFGMVSDHAAPTDNLFFSPFSISSALGMTLAGAQGETESQMRSVFHVGDDELAHHRGYGELSQVVFAKGSGCNSTLNMANRLFGQTGYPWLTEFMEVTDLDYGAPLEEIDFIDDPEYARGHINDWVADQTEDRIEELLPAGAIKPITRLVIANAVYFQADWEHAFDERNTYDASFTRADGSIVTTPVMYETIKARSARVEGIVAVELDYVGGAQSMVLMMPENASDENTSAIRAGLVDAVEDAFQPPSDLLVGLPRFSFEQETDLKQVLLDLGMTDAFEPGLADLTAMADPSVTGEPLYIGGAYHKAFVAVDESGTEAAAATAVVVDAETSAISNEFIANRTFEFYIRDNVSGTVLFMGRVGDPTAE